MEGKIGGLLMDLIRVRERTEANKTPWFLALTTNKGELERKNKFGDTWHQKFGFGPAQLEKAIRHSSGDI